MIESIELFYFSITNYTQRMKRQIADPFFAETKSLIDSSRLHGNLLIGKQQKRGGN